MAPMGSLFVKIHGHAAFTKNVVFGQTQITNVPSVMSHGGGDVVNGTPGQVFVLPFSAPPCFWSASKTYGRCNEASLCAGCESQDCICFVFLVHVYCYEYAT